MRRKKTGLQFHSNKLTTWKCLKEESTSHWVSFVDFYSIPLFSIFFCINQITRWKQKNIIIELSLHEYSYIPPTPKRPSTLNEGHIWMISWNFNNFIWWNELKNIRVLFHKAAVYLTWLGNLFCMILKKC